MSKVNNNQCKFCFEEALKKGMIGKNNGLEIIANVNAWVNIYVSFVSYYFTFPVAYQVNKLDRKLLREESWQHFLLMRRLNFSIMRHATYFIRLPWHFLCFYNHVLCKTNFCHKLYLYFHPTLFKYLMMWFTLYNQYATIWNPRISLM